MYLLYVDESGDPGKIKEGQGLNSKHFILSGLIISQEDWFANLDRLKIFRKMLRDNFGLRLRDEIHCSELIRINKMEAYKSIKKKDRLKIFELFISQIPIIFDTAKVINICFDKSKFESTQDIQELAWKRLVQRSNTYLKKSVNDKGIIISDTTNETLIRNLLRKMRIYNPVSSHYGGYYNTPIDSIIEDAFMRDSKHSYFIQAVDAIAQALYRKKYPKSSLKKYNVDKYFENFRSNFTERSFEYRYFRCSKKIKNP